MYIFTVPQIIANNPANASVTRWYRLSASLVSTQTKLGKHFLHSLEVAQIKIMNLNVGIIRLL